MDDCLVCAFEPCDQEIHTAVANVRAWIKEDTLLTLSFHEKFARELERIRRHQRMSQGIDIIGQGMTKEEVLEKILMDLYDFLDHDYLIVNPEADEDTQYYVKDWMEQARAYYEQG